MNTTDWLIMATMFGPVIGTLVAPGVRGALLALARARASEIVWVPARGADLYRYGVPMHEPQFLEMFAVYQAELAELPPPAERTEWDMKRQYAAAQRLAVLTGTHPQAFPNVGEPSQAWSWYADRSPYATGQAMDDQLRSGNLLRRMIPRGRWDRVSTASAAPDVDG
jgi:hypothetical protein